MNEEIATRTIHNPPEIEKVNDLPLSEFLIDFHAGCAVCSCLFPYHSHHGSTNHLSHNSLQYHPSRRLHPAHARHETIINRFHSHGSAVPRELPRPRRSIHSERQRRPLAPSSILRNVPSPEVGLILRELLRLESYGSLPPSMAQRRVPHSRACRLPQALRLIRAVPPIPARDGLPLGEGCRHTTQHTDPRCDRLDIHRKPSSPNTEARELSQASHTSVLQARWHRPRPLLWLWFDTRSIQGAWAQLHRHGACRDILRHCM